MSRVPPPILQPAPAAPAAQRPPIPMAEFVPLVAALMALGAMGVDAMLPALPAIRRDLGVADPNAPQWVIALYLIGLGVGQLVHGPASDHWGRRPVMLAALGSYALANVAAALCGSFALLLALRFAAAVMIAATRAVTLASVRDCFAGRPMARVMSLAAVTFMIAPVLAPAVGQGVLLVGSWRLIFAGIAALTLAVMAWYALRLPETLAPAARRRFAPAGLAEAARLTLTDRWSAGYMAAQTCMQGALFGYVNSVGQVVGTEFGASGRLPAVFALAAAGMIAANLLNARLVLRLGSRVLSQGALVAMAAAAAAGLALDRAGGDTLWRFVAVQAAVSGCFALANSNFSALAMTGMGRIAGTASSIQGFVTVTGGALLGAGIGQAFAGTAAPLHAGSLLAALAAFATVAVTERGRLFRPA